MLWIIVHRNIWSDFDGSAFVVGSFEFPKCVSAYWFKASVWFRARGDGIWSDLGCVDTDIILTATVWEAEYWCSLFRTLTQLALCYYRLDKQREQGSIYEVEWKEARQNSLRSRRHLMLWMPCDGFQSHLTYCLPCSEINPCWERWQQTRSHRHIVPFWLHWAALCGATYAASWIKHRYEVCCDAAVKYKTEHIHQRN